MSPLSATLDPALVRAVVDVLPGTLFIASDWRTGSPIRWVRSAEGEIVDVRAGDRIPDDLFRIDPSHRQVILSRLEAEGEVREVVVAFQQEPGRAPRWGRLTVVPIEAEGDRGALFQIVDVTASRSLAERSGDDTHLVGGLDALQQQKNRLISVFSHDLRNPLTVILGNAQLIEADDCSEDIRESAEDIHAAAERMREIIDTLVLTRKLEDPALAPERVPVDLVEVATRALDKHRDAAERKGIAVSLRGAPLGEVSSDAGMLEVVLDAFLSNAVKFLPSGGTAALSIEATDGGTRISLSDNGPGLSAEELSRAFEKFSKLTPPPTGDEGCLGLGLYLAERAARSVDARVGAASDGVGRGSTFYVEITR